jgi:hypothetical protein
MSQNSSLGGALDVFDAMLSTRFSTDSVGTIVLALTYKLLGVAVCGRLSSPSLRRGALEKNLEH